MKSKKEKILTSLLWASRFTTWISFDISVLIWGIKALILNPGGHLACELNRKTSLTQTLPLVSELLLSRLPPLQL